MVVHPTPVKVIIVIGTLILTLEATTSVLVFFVLINGSVGVPVALWEAIQEGAVVSDELLRDEPIVVASDALQ